MAEAVSLAIELVPKTSWGANLRKVLPSSTWDKIRKASYAKYGYRCGICNAEERLSCHEIWEYDDKNHNQRLLGLIALCDMCHHVKHIGRAAILAVEGKLDYERVVQHYMTVNGCDRQTFECHRKEAFDLWRERSRHKWNVDIGEYAQLAR